MPSKFPNLPGYLSSNSKTPREGPDDRRKRHEEDYLKLALQKSAAEQKNYDSKRMFSSLDDLHAKIEYIDTSVWTVFRKTDQIIFAKIITDTAPVIECSLVIDDKLSTSAYIYETQVYKLGTYSFPLNISHIDTLNNIFEALIKSVCVKKSDATDIMKTVIYLLKKMMKCDGNEMLKLQLKFIEEQLSLCFLNKNGLRYSSDLMIFSALFFNMAPHAYNFVRNSKNILLPHPSTIRRICLSYDVKPDAETLNSNFLMYVRHKFNLLEDNDKKVILMIDEIHLKQHLDYKGGNICGLSYDNKNLANSAHVFMISSLLSKYKDVIHILPTNKINAEIIHEIVKKIIIGLEEIVFFCNMCRNG